MLSVDIKVDFSEAKRMLAGIKEQLPFAIAKALTDTAKDARQAVTAELPKVFDRPNPFTMRAIAFKPANKQTLTAIVYIQPKQAEYLRLQLEGGTRLPRARALALSTDYPLDQYGNVPRGALRRLMARPDVFSGTVRGIAGIWQRTHPRLTLLFAYEPKARYGKRLPFEAIVRRTVNERIEPNFRNAMDLAIRTAR